jgi:hypothetical protein
MSHLPVFHSNIWQETQTHCNSLLCINAYYKCTNICTISSAKLTIKLLRHVSVLIHNLQRVYKLFQLKLLIIVIYNFNNS